MTWLRGKDLAPEYQRCLLPGVCASAGESGAVYCWGPCRWWATRWPARTFAYSKRRTFNSREGLRNNNVGSHLPAFSFSWLRGKDLAPANPALPTAGGLPLVAGSNLRLFEASSRLGAVIQLAPCRRQRRLQPALTFKSSEGAQK